MLSLKRGIKQGDREREKVGRKRENGEKEKGERRDGRDEEKKE